MDRRTNALPNRPTNRPTGTASYRGALPHLKRGQTLKQTEPETDTEIWTVTKGNADRDRVRSSHPIKSQFGSCVKTSYLDATTA